MKHDTGFLLLAAWCLLLLQRLVCEIAEEVKPEIKFQSQAIVVLPWLALKDQFVKEKSDNERCPSLQEYQVREVCVLW